MHNFWGLVIVKIFLPLRNLLREQLEAARFVLVTHKLQLKPCVLQQPFPRKQLFKICRYTIPPKLLHWEKHIFELSIVFFPLSQFIEYENVFISLVIKQPVFY